MEDVNIVLEDGLDGGFDLDLDLALTSYTWRRPNGQIRRKMKNII